MPDGLAAYFSGVGDDFVFAPDNVSVGTVDALANQPVIADLDAILMPPNNFADAVTDAQTFITEGEGLLTKAATDLSMGDFADAAFADAGGSFAIFDLPSQLLLMGAAEGLGI